MDQEVSFCLLPGRACLLLPVVHCSMSPSLKLRVLMIHSNETYLHYPSCTIFNWEGSLPIV